MPRMRTAVKGKRDRAILVTLLFHGLRRAELCCLKVGDCQQRQDTGSLRRSAPSR